MKLKGIFANKPGAFQLTFLILIMLAGTMIASLLSVGVLYLLTGQTTSTDNSDYIRIVQLLSATGIFLFPALFGAYLYSKRPTFYLQITRLPSFEMLLWTFVSMVCIGPFINLTGFFNRQMKFPEFMRPIEEWMQLLENTAEQVTKQLLITDSIVTVLFNLLVIAIAAGITEEFLFRGTLQRIFGKWFSNPHTVIWIVALIFSAIHLQFYGFLPRLLLGAFFGYLLYWGGNLWIPVFAHFVNNAVAVIAMSNSKWKDNEWITGDISSEQMLPYIPATLLATFLFYFCVKKLRSSLVSNKAANDIE